VAGERLYVGTHDGHVLALDRSTGRRLWSFAGDDSVLAAPSLDAGRLYFGSYGGHVYALEAAAGTLLWKYDTRRPVVSTPAVARGKVLVGSRSYDFLALDAKSGVPAWTRYLWFSWVESSPVVRDAVAYVGSSDAARISAFDVDTGRTVWETDVHGWAWGRPAVTGDRVFVGTSSSPGYLVGHQAAALALDRATGRVVWREVVPPAKSGTYGFTGEPAVGAGLVFFGGLDGKVRAYRASPAPGDGSR
jgi:glucose dehydrogenase